MRGRGALTLPARLRDRYGISEGDPLTLVDLDGVLVLVPKVSVVRKLAEDVERIRKSEGIELEELLEGVAQERGHRSPTRRGRR
jgi:AbrB family looped-hinge helix DNA binding protein